FLAYVDAAGRYADFHSLRHTCGSLLAAAGVHPKVAQSIMRHSDINLTMARYSHVYNGQEAAAIAKLPDFGKTNSKKKQREATA
ncbi:MAG TPA: tyrosine-type recombinase/integrase, partial [Planctomycetota bacterium]|nr:tyrosine-type recombinase/integrase [Planctomycetota bacterium]